MARPELCAECGSDESYACESGGTCHDAQAAYDQGALDLAYAVCACVCVDPAQNVQVKELLRKLTGEGGKPQ